MKKFLLVMCFLGTANLFAETCNGFCSSVVFQNDSAYIKTDVIPVLKLMCDKYGVLEVACDSIDFRADGSAWILDSEVEKVYKYCTTCSLKEDNTPEAPSIWEQFMKAASTVTWRR